MELPAPDVDELGRPWWGGTGADVSKAYRRLSILVHPARHREDSVSLFLWKRVRLEI